MFKRTISLYAAVCVMFGGLLWRTMELSTTQSAQALQQSHTRTLTVGTSRGVIYDRWLTPLAPVGERLLAAIAPCDAAKETLAAEFGTDAATKMLQSGTPCLSEAQQQLDSAFARTFPVPVRQNEGSLASQLLGKLDGNGQGISGIERAFDETLSAAAGSLSVRFFVDATGRVLPGEGKEILDRNYQSCAGIALTVDADVQRIAETALGKSCIRSGCVLIMDIATGEMLAVANTEGSEVNRALQAYSVGSVFKPLLAAFALEQGVSKKFTYTCTGECRIGDTRFPCYGKKAHGKQHMKQALENSCNTYFINLMQEIDASRFLSFCRSLGFGQGIPLCDGLTCSGGSLPNERDLLLAGERANLAFGQGKLLASPVQILSVYQMLATGLQTPPTVLRGTVDANGALTSRPPFAPVRRLSEKTVRTMCALLTASGKAVGATAGAGKTGTAQSGIIEGGKEVCRTWFAGFFPSKEPQYAVVVLNENGVSGAADCAPVFRAICEALTG